MSRLLLAAWAVVLASLPLPGMAAESTPPAVEITEWEVPWPDSRPRDPWFGPDGKVWFVGQIGHYVATLDPTSGAFQRYDLEDGTGPHTVIVDERGAWYAGNRTRHIGHIDPRTGKRTIYPLPGEGARDPHTMTFAKDGVIWFTAQHGNQVGQLQPATGTITLYEMPTPRSRPYGLVVDSGNRPWFALFGSNALGTLDPATGEVRELSLPRRETRPRRLAVTTDGMVWYVDFAYGYLGRYNPETGSVDEWPVPGGRAAGPYAMGTDDRGRLWFVETGPRPNRLVGFDPATEAFTTPVPIPSGGGSVRHMMYHDATGSFWFGTDTNTIGRAVVR